MPSVKNKQKTGLNKLNTMLQNKLLQTLFLIASTLLCFIGSYLVFGIRYFVNDDAVISNIAAGAYGYKSQYLVYVNVLIGWLLKPFYYIYSGFNWYAALLMLAAATCFIFLGRLFIRKFGPVPGMLLHLSMMVFYGIEFFSTFHYVRYSGLLLVCGLAYICANFGKWNLGTIGGIIAALFGSMLRFHEFISVGGLSAALLIFLFFKAKDKKERIRSASAIIIFVAAAFMLKGIDTLAYKNDENWANYWEYNSARTEIVDYKIYHKGARAAFLEMGYSENNFDMLDSWSFYDDNVFPLEALREIGEGLPSNSIISSVFRSFKTVLLMLHQTPLGFMLAAVLIGWFLFSGKKRGFAAGGIMLIFMLEVLYLQYLGRFPSWVSSSLMFACMIFLLLCFERPEKEKQLSSSALLRAQAAITMLLLVFSIGYYYNFKIVQDEFHQSRPAQADATTEFANDKSTLYILDTVVIDAVNGFDIWHPREKDYFSNIVYAGSWLMYSPFQEQALERYGVENIYRDSINRPDVVFLDFVNAASKEEHIRSYYDPSAKIEMFKSTTHYNYYRVVSPG